MKRKLKVIAWGVLLALFVTLVQLICKSEFFYAAKSYTNAKDFYLSTALNGESYHAEAYNGKVYYATKAKLASSSTNTKYSTVGFDVTLSGNGYSVSFTVQRTGGSMTEIKPSVKSGDYEYILYAIEEEKLYELATKADAVSAAKVLESSVINVRMDAIMITKKGNTANGGITENGSGGFTKWGTIYRLKNNSDIMAMKDIFTGHDFKSYVKIQEELNNYQLTVRYAVNGTPAVSSDSSTKAAVSSSYRLANYTKDGVTTPFVLYNSDKTPYTSAARTVDKVSLLNPSTVGLTKTGYYLPAGSEWITENGKSFAGNKAHQSTSICPEVGTGDKDITLYANWKPAEYTITYHASGGTGTMADTAATYDKAVNLRANVFIRTGYTFKGWAMSEGGAVKYTDREAVMNLTATNGDKINLYAVWEANVYTITLDSDGADVPGTASYYEKYATGNYADSYALNKINTITKPEKKGYTFGGYYSGKNGTGTKYIDADGKILNISSPAYTEFTTDTTLYAKWTANTYTIRYHANGGTGTMADTSAVYDKTLTLRGNTFEKTGHAFQGWALSEDGTVAYADKEEVKYLTDQKNGTVNLYAVWEPLNVLITLNPQEGSGGTPFFYEKYGVNFFSDGLFLDVISKIAVPLRTGYEFQGYFKDVIGNGSPAVNADGTIAAENTAFLKDTTLFANWQAKKFKITFEKEGGQYGTDYVTATYDRMIPQAEAPVRTGYRFEGYFTERNGNGVSYYNSFMNTDVVYREVKDTTLYAYWVDDYAPEVTLHVSNGAWTNQKVTLTADARDYGTGLESVTIYQIGEDGSTLKEVAKASSLNGTNTKQLTFVNTEEGVVRYKAVATDLNGNTAESYNTVYYDTTAPTGDVVQFEVNGTVFDIVIDITDINAGN